MACEVQFRQSSRLVRERGADKTLSTKLQELVVGVISAEEDV